MSEQPDLQSFQIEVLQEIENLQHSSFVGRVQNGLFVPLAEKGGKEQRLFSSSPVEARPPEEVKLEEYEGKIIVIDGQVFGNEIWSARILDTSAAEIVSRKDMRQHLCPALQSVSNDAFDIAKVSTPVLASLSLAGVLTIPLNPVLFAVIALLIARMGIASFCVDYKKDKAKE
jgi:hypothetical protein